MATHASEVIKTGRNGNPDVIKCLHPITMGRRRINAHVIHSVAVGCSYCEEESPLIKAEAVGAAR